MMGHDSLSIRFVQEVADACIRGEVHEGEEKWVEVDECATFVAGEEKWVEVDEGATFVVGKEKNSIRIVASFRISNSIKIIDAQ
uniref:Protein kinase domain-containing protein n=1 Tax=Panagrellus redivivus TaxID=6233 RepID=A0A7E4W048_PANRE